MKTLSYFFMITGLLIMALFVCVMFGAFSQYINTDRVWLSLLFGGMGISSIGFLLDAWIQVPRNMYEVDIQNQNITGMVICIVCCSILFTLIQFI